MQPVRAPRPKYSMSFSELIMRDANSRVKTMNRKARGRTPVVAPKPKSKLSDILMRTPFKSKARKTPIKSLKDYQPFYNPVY